MRRAISCFVLILLLGFYMASPLAAETLTNLEESLKSWQGAREVQFLSTESDPLSSAELLPLIETFLKFNFAVSTATEKDHSGAGLVVELRRMESSQTLIVLKRAADNAIIALERVAADHRPVATTPAVAPAVVPQTSRTLPPMMEPTRQLAPIPLDDTPVSVVWLGGSYAAGGDLALLSDAGVTLYRLQEKQLQKRSVTAPPRKGLRPLKLSRGDIDGDGSIELSAVWAEDLYSIYDGTDSKIWSQLFAFKQQQLSPLGLQSGYVRLFSSGAVIQQRGTYSPFSGPIQKLLCRQGEVSIGQALSWGEQNIFSLTPWGDENGLAWTQPGHLSVLSLTTGEVLPGGTLLEDFGAIQGTEIAVRLEEPEYRSGFEKEDKVLETYTSLPPRLVRSGENAMLTIYRGRKSGSFLFGRQGGEDRLVRLLKLQDDYVLEYPFPSVKSFIIDFVLLPGRDNAGALLLLNDREEADGRAYLLYQRGG